MDICAVIVTFNRLECLKKALKKYEEQLKRPKYLLIVNNNSSDGTKEYLETWKQEPSEIQKIVLHLPSNTGGAGGFHAGMEKALELDCDWVWVSDDDAYPEPDAFEKLNLFEKNNPELMKNTVALCSKVMDYEKKYIGLGHRVNEGRVLGVPCLPKKVKETEYKKSYFYFDHLSYVGSMIRKSALKEAGLVNGDFFIYSDDYEHSIRLGKVGKFICVTDSCVCHEGESDEIPVLREAVWRDYYATRNILLALKWHYGMPAFYFRAGCRIATAIKSGNWNKIRIFWAGIQDAKNDIVGIHSVYKPGWKEKT